MRFLPVALLLALAACSAVPPPPVETDYAVALMRRSVPAPVPFVLPAEPKPDPEMPSPAPASPLQADPVPAATDDAALDEFAVKPFGAGDLAALAVLRSEEVGSARARLEAARTGYRQAADLDDLAALYRSWSRDLDTRVGPARHRVPASAISPSPNVSAYSGEIASLTVELAREDLRAVELRVAAEARRAHAEVARWAEARRIVTEDLQLMEGLLSVVRVRLESGQADQSGYLGFLAAVARRRTDLEVLDARAPSLRADLNRILARPEDAPIHLDLIADGAAGGAPDAPAVIRRAQSDCPATRSASVRAKRAAVAVRMAETMTLPRFDVGSARYERERVGEAGVDRGTVFPEPGRMIMPRSDFGVREAQVTEMRATAAALEATARDVRGRTATAVRDALFSLTSAEKRLTTLTKDVVPLAERALRATRGSYEGNRSGYLDLLEAARRLLRAKLDRAGAQRDVSVARADLLVAAGFDPGKEED